MGLGERVSRYKKINLASVVFFFIIFVSNTLEALCNFKIPLQELLLHPPIYTNLVPLLLFCCLLFLRESKIGKIIQVFVFYFVGILLILVNEDMSNITGHIVIILFAFPLSRRYDLFSRYQKNYIIGVLILTTVVTAISVHVHSTYLSHYMATSILILYLFSLFYFTHEEYILEIIASRQKSLDELKNEKQQLLKRVQELDRIILLFEEERHVEDLEKHKLSPGETNVLRALVQTKGSNKEIAKHLGLKEQTIKYHLWNICNKTGMGDRLELIELFRYSFDKTV